MTPICPCCGKADRLTRFQKRMDIDNRRVDIDICTYCLALVNVTDLEASTLAPDEEDASEGAFYKADQEATDRIPQLLEQGENVVSFLLSHLAEPLPAGAFVDLGAGLGHVAAAAKAHFGESWALDFNAFTLEEMARRYPAGFRPKVGTALNDVTDPVSAVVAWHSFQEMTSPHQVAIETFEKLQPGGVLFLQAPAYRDAYVVRSHKTFFNEYALGKFCTEAGFVCENVWHDEDAQFLSCLARKPA
jgi:hypothetical protein